MTQPKVLFIIDDDRDDQEFLMEALKEIDPSCDCYTAMNGQEGLKKLENNAIPFPSLIFLDLNMPRINGQKFLATLKREPRFSSIPVVIYTTSSHQKDIDEMKQLGAVNYLVKQPDNSLLKENLSAILSVIL